jgi:hypothetical protein
MNADIIINVIDATSLERNLNVTLAASWKENPRYRVLEFLGRYAGIGVSPLIRDCLSEHARRTGGDHQRSERRRN